MIDPTGTTTLTYNTSYLLEQIHYPTGFFLEYTYDSLGRRTSMTDQDGKELQYTYNILGMLESISETGKRVRLFTMPMMQSTCLLPEPWAIVL